LWAVPLEQVMADVAAGRIPSRTERGLLFVDIDPAAGQQPQAQSTPPAPYRRSLAWAMGGASSQPIVTAEERAALLNESTNDVPAEFNDDDGETPADDAPAPFALTSEDIPNWDEVRSRVSQTRRAPATRAA
jgi:hypothetical protein